MRNFSAILCAIAAFIPGLSQCKSYEEHVRDEIKSFRNTWEQEDAILEPKLWGKVLDRYELVKRARIISKYVPFPDAATDVDYQNAVRDLNRDAVRKFEKEEFLHDVEYLARQAWEVDQAVKTVIDSIETLEKWQKQLAQIRQWFTKPYEGDNMAYKNKQFAPTDDEWTWLVHAENGLRGLLEVYPEYKELESICKRVRRIVQNVFHRWFDAWQPYHFKLPRALFDSYIRELVRRNPSNAWWMTFWKKLRKDIKEEEKKWKKTWTEVYTLCDKIPDPNGKTPACAAIRAGNIHHVRVAFLKAIEASFLGNFNKGVGGSRNFPALKYTSDDLPYALEYARQDLLDDLFEDDDDAPTAEQIQRDVKNLEQVMRGTKSRVKEGEVKNKMKDMIKIKKFMKRVWKPEGKNENSGQYGITQAMERALEMGGEKRKETIRTSKKQRFSQLKPAVLVPIASVLNVENNKEKSAVPGEQQRIHDQSTHFENKDDNPSGWGEKEGNFNDFSKPS